MFPVFVKLVALDDLLTVASDSLQVLFRGPSGEVVVNP